MVQTDEKKDKTFKTKAGITRGQGFARRKKRRYVGLDIMNNLPEKPEEMSVEDVTSLVLSYNDPNLITQILTSCGWGVSEEIFETLKVVRQNLNLGAKMTAIKHLRTLLKESAEAAGMIGSVSRTIPGADGSTTVFSAKRITTALNPRKQIKSEEINDGRKERTEQTDTGGSPESEGGGDAGDGSRGADAGGGSDSSSGEHIGTDEIGTATPAGDNSSEERSSGDDFGSAGDGDGDDERRAAASEGIDNTDNPCIQHQPPTCRRDLYPGVSG